MEKYICQKCKGTGYLVDYDHIQNGKCFACNGLGYITEENGKKLYIMSGIDKDDNIRKVYFGVEAETEKDAIKKANKMFKRGSAVIPGTAQVEKCEIE